MLQLLYQMETFFQWLENQLRIRGWKPADLSRASGISNATISRILNSTRQAGPDACKKIARALQVSQEEVFRRRGFLDPLPPGVLDNHMTPQERELISLHRNLNPDRREAAMDVMRGLAQNMTRHYTFMPTAENQLTAAVIQEILSLYRQNQKSEAVLKLLGHTSTEQQEDMQEFLIQLSHDIERWLHQLEAGKAECEIEVGGRAT